MRVFFFLYTATHLFFSYSPNKTKFSPKLRIGIQVLFCDLLKLKSTLFEFFKIQEHWHLGAANPHFPQVLAVGLTKIVIKSRSTGTRELQILTSLSFHIRWSRIVDPSITHEAQISYKSCPNQLDINKQWNENLESQRLD